MADIDIIKEIETILKIKLERLDELKQDSRGYTINKDGNVLGLSLYWSGTKSLDKIIKQICGFKILDCLILDWNRLIDIKPLAKMTNLSTLYLSNNDLIDIKPLSNLSNLFTLHLSNNDLSDIKPLSNLKNLSTLDLSNNELSDIKPLSNLLNLSTIYLNLNALSDINALSKLSKLSKLILNFNELINIKPLSTLTNLSTLDLGGNELIDIKPLASLSNMLNLDLHNNELSDIEPLSNLSNLSTLNLSKNKLNDIELLSNLSNLSTLNISKNKLNDIESLSNLANLSTLDLSSNLLADIEPLSNLSNLSTLDLSSNLLADIEPLSNLSNLSTLDLSSNLLADIKPLSNLSNLSTLDLGSNHLSDIKPLSNLSNLSTLHLGKNKLSYIKPLKNLKNINKLDLRENNITDLPVWITNFNMKIIWTVGNEEYGINLMENPLKKPPSEIVKQGKEAIINYFKQIDEQGKDYIYEAKVMIVGEPGAGKSTLMEKLFDRKYPVPDNEQKSTLGIEVRHNWPFTNKGQNIKAHIWDFGGQEIQYMLHQFFLTTDCIYILMADKRKELTNFDYWLDIINLLGKNSRVILVFNEINIDTATTPIYDEKKYRELFPEMDIHRLEVNLANMDDGRFDTLVRIIKEKIISLNIIGKEVPAKWLDIRDEIEEIQDKKCISIDEYYKICKKNKINNETDCELILKYFHLLGIILHFSDDINLKTTIFLDPNWTVGAVYAVLTDPVIQNNNGIFEFEIIDNIWHNKGYEKLERNRLFQLMLKDKFDLCYKLPGTDNRYIVPLLLSANRPDYKWDDDNNLLFRFQYPFMPKGIVSRLIVRLNEYIEYNLVWNNGVIFQRNNVRAQVIEKTNPKDGLKLIEIKLAGNPNSRKELLTIIREEIYRIQKSSFLNLPFSEMVPCKCSECKNNTDPYFYEYNVLSKYIEKNKRTIECHNSAEDVPIDELIDAVYIKNSDTDNFGRDSKITMNKPTNKIKIFLASSSELKEDRKEFEIFINRKNKDLHEEGIFLELILWEDFIDAMSRTRLQDEYNKAVKESDIFISLFFTKVGKYTKEEFETAYKAFISKGKPKHLYTYFKEAEIKTTSITKEINTLLDFKKRLEELEHFPTIYKNTDDLLRQVENQLNEILSDLLKRSK
jgi:internalin A